MTHEDKIEEIVEMYDHLTYPPLAGNPAQNRTDEELLEIHDKECEWLRQTLTTYRAQVLEEVERPFINMVEKTAISKEDTIALRCTDIFLKHVESLKHPTN